MSIQEHVNAVREKMAAAAKAAGRDPGEITLCAATKVQTDDTIREAIAAGITVCGENRVQELTAHLEANAYEGAQVHFIGHLQRNKVKQVVGHVALIQSVGSLELLDEIEKVAAARGLVQDILLEVNIGGEASKSGISPEELSALAAQAVGSPHVRLRGLMAIPPICEKKAELCGYFSAVRQSYVDIAAKKLDNVSMNCLSMGMSSDFQEAIACGATMVRVGSSLFGKRDYPQHYYAI